MTAKQIWRGAGLLVAGLVVSLGFEYGFDLLLHPWAYPMVMGRGVLGTWKGSFSIPGSGTIKANYQLLHEIYKEEGPMLEGRSFLCSANPLVQGSTLSGKVSWLGKEVQISDSSTFGPWGSPASFLCHYDSDHLNCVMDFSRKHSPELQKLAQKVGIEFQREPIRFVMIRALEGEQPEACPEATK